MGTLFTALGAAAALSVTDIIPVHQGGARAVGLTGAQLLTLVGTTYVPLAGGTMTGALTIASGTLTASSPAINVTQTWNNGAISFVGQYFNVTNTASNGGSYLFGYYVNGSEQVYATVSGTLFAGGYRVGNGANGVWTSSGLQMRSDGFYAFSSTTNASGTLDLYLYRDAAAVLAQRNGTNAQTLRVYRSYTDASNYSRFTHGWNTSTALLMAEGLGTGTDGNIAFNDAALATGATLGYIMVPSAAGVSTGVPADIPTGQTPIVFDSTNKKIGAYTGGAWVWTAALS